jgi:hypothetical protein
MGMRRPKISVEVSTTRTSCRIVCRSRTASSAVRFAASAVSSSLPRSRNSKKARGILRLAASR